MRGSYLPLARCAGRRQGIHKIQWVVGLHLQNFYQTDPIAKSNVMKSLSLNGKINNVGTIKASWIDCLQIIINANDYKR